MNLVTPLVSNGSKKLILNQSTLCDDKEDLVISIPTIIKREEKIVFRFKSGFVLVPTVEVHSEEKGVSLLILTLGTKNYNFVALKHSVEVVIAGKKYHLLFCVTRIIGNTVRVEISLYE